MNEKEWNQLMKDLDESPGFVKDNVLCYFYYNSCNCTKCPRNEKCPQRLRALSLKQNISPSLPLEETHA
jgi:hypothetical protein